MSLPPIAYKKQVLLITYDLKTPGKIYTNFYDAIKTQGIWWHYLSTTWLVETTRSSQEVYNNLSPHLGGSDLILIIEISANYWGTLPKDAWDWISQHLS